MYSTRLGAGFVAAIIAVVMLIAAGVTAATDAGVRSSSLQLTGSEQILAAGEPVELGEGISLTPADGWTVTDKGDGVVVVEKDDTASMFVRVKKAESSDVEGELHDDIQQFTKKSGMKVTGYDKVLLWKVDSEHFRQAAGVGYAAEVSTQQGTTTLVGQFNELMNPSDRLSAFVVFIAPDKESYDAAIESMWEMWFTLF